MNRENSKPMKNCSEEHNLKTTTLNDHEKIRNKTNYSLAAKENSKVHRRIEAQKNITETRTEISVSRTAKEKCGGSPKKLPHGSACSPPAAFNKQSARHILHPIKNDPTQL